MTEYLTFTVQTSNWLMIDRLTDCQIVFGDVLDRKQASPDYKIINVFSRQIGFFLSVSVVYEFGQKFEISSLLVFGQNRPRNCVW